MLSNGVEHVVQQKFRAASWGPLSLSVCAMLYTDQLRMQAIQ